jgi:transcription antitermination factor NusG
MPFLAKPRVTECDSQGGAMSGFQPHCEQTISESDVRYGTVALGQPSWYAVRTLARHEKKVATQLQGKGVTAFLPLVAQVHKWSDRRKVVELPLFPGYAFVRVVPSITVRLTVLHSPGVVGFVGIHGKAVPIPAKQIEDIQCMLANHIPCAPYPFLREGQRVRIRGGCLDGVQGIFATLNQDRSLIVSVDLIQRSLAIRINGYDLEAV